MDSVAIDIDGETLLTDLALAAATVTSLAISLFVARRITGPFQQMTQASERISATRTLAWRVKWVSWCTSPPPAETMPNCLRDQSVSSGLVE